ncbi:unnamed protein product [Echinostoma caproni]|uniref:Glycosyl transferase n=1 Tax=Echinostoma caproni TaxID=27848 RepID=A0A183B1A1_9TREM|nr:unnamed protein product [Echinostoma caproni]
MDMQNLYKAHRHSRSGQTKTLIERSLQLLAQLQSETQQIADHSIPSEPVETTNEVCPEFWDSTRPDKIWLQNIYRTQPCNRIPLEQLVEIVLYMETCTGAHNLVHRIHAVYPKIVIHLAVGLTLDSNDTMCKSLPLNQTLFGAKENAQLWVQLAERVQTKYVLIGRNMVEFTPYTDLDRLLRVMHQLQADVVGGAVRLEPDGHWYAGCYQVRRRVLC